MRIVFFYILISVLFLSACDKDEYVYPPAITEIVSAQTDDEGTLGLLITDKGVALHVENAHKYSGMVSDTLYRMVAVYELKGAQKDSVHLYSFAPTISYEPIALSQLAGEMKTDPVGVQSIWRSGDYLNMILLVKAQGKKHVFHFVETEDEAHCLALTLYHDKGENIEAYTRRAYISIPLKKYKDVLSKGDPIFFSLNTYKEGMKTYRLEY